MRWTRTHSRLVLLAAVAAVLLPAATASPAMAGSLTGSATSISYNGAGTEANDVTISRSVNTYTITDIVAITDGNAMDTCTATGGLTATCTATGLTFVGMSLGNGNDENQWAGSYADLPLFTQIDGGAGTDTLNGTEKNDTLFSSSGPEGDTYNGEAGDDSLGNEFVFGSPEQGGDIFNGGPGTDRLSYSGRGAGVTVTANDGLANDGEQSEQDNVGADVEVITATSFNDSITGGGVNNQLTGQGGDDTLNGGAGEDSLPGGAGNDTVDGGPGSDGVEGGDGNDTLTGGTGVDDIQGGNGSDSIDSNDGERDDVDCGGNTDTVTADSNDTVAGDCENVTGASFGGPPGPAGPGGPAGPAGPAGPQGRPGRNATVRCRPGRVRRGRVRVRCRVTFRRASASRVKATLVRRGRVYAFGSGRGSTITLVSRRRIRAGRYTLVLRSSSAVTRQRVTVR